MRGVALLPGAEDLLVLLHRKPKAFLPYPESGIVTGAELVKMGPDGIDGCLFGYVTHEAIKQ